jgi:hypothetical protein
MSSRSQALFRSITEVEHVLRQQYLQFNQQSRSSTTLISGPEMVLENSACVAGRNSTEVGTTVPTQALQLDDRLLADIGVSRTAVEEVRRSHLYLIAWRDSR